MGCRVPTTIQLIVALTGGSNGYRHGVSGTVAQFGRGSALRGRSTGPVCSVRRPQSSGGASVKPRGRATAGSRSNRTASARFLKASTITPRPPWSGLASRSCQGQARSENNAVLEYRPFTSPGRVRRCLRAKEKRVVVSRCAAGVERRRLDVLYGLRRGRRIGVD